MENDVYKMIAGICWWRMESYVNNQIEKCVNASIGRSKRKE